MRTRLALLLPVGGLLAAHGQGAPRSMPLGAPNATLDADFTRVAAVRELADGRVLVTDAAERKLMVVDFPRDTSAVIGREGQGPGEYRSVGQLFALAGDSTLLVDAAGGRWLLLHGATIVQTVGGDSPAIREGARLPLGADVRGAVLATRPMGSPPSASPGAMPSRMDSVHLVRIARATGRADTVGALASRPSRIDIQGPRDRPTAVTITVNPIATGDQAAMFSDGAIAIARVSPYRVDWIVADRRPAMGAPLPFTRIAVDTREKEAIMKRQAEASGRAARPPESVADWPDVLPPFLSGGVLAAGDGRLWIRRTPSAADSGSRYDVVDRGGRLSAQITTARDEQIVGFGRGTVYSVRTDEDGVQRLRRHPLPR